MSVNCRLTLVMLPMAYVTTPLVVSLADVKTASREMASTAQVSLIVFFYSLVD